MFTSLVRDSYTRLVYKTYNQVQLGNHSVSPYKRLNCYRSSELGCQPCVRCSTPQKVAKAEHPKNWLPALCTVLHTQKSSQNQAPQKVAKTETRTHSCWNQKIVPYPLNCMALYVVRYILTYITVFTNDGPLMRMCPG